MPDMRPPTSDLPDHLIAVPRAETVRRALDRLRRGAIQPLEADQGVIVVAAVETLTAATLGALRAAGRGKLQLAMTRFRAGALGLEAEDETVLATLAADATLDEIIGVAEPAARTVSGSLASDAAPTEDRPIVAALSLAKLAGLMPMIVVARDAAPRADLAALSILDVEGFAEASARWLTQVADARVPLAEAENARLIAFRPWGGGPEHLAIVIGTPDARKPVLTRIHSSCFTGDLLGSLRCDCGDQLRGAIRAIAAEGSGVVVYLPQEGRGIGLVNKLRAYALQDAGFDTIDANTHLGFAPDERSYAAAGEILRRLGIARIRLLTNNPGKGEALAGLGVDVVERVKLSFPSNPYNAAYLRTKAVRDGHNF